jgi:hypothetical protein
MRFLGIRLSDRRLPPGRAFRRLIGLGLSFITFGIGFLGIVFGESRRGWDDRMARTEVVYDERQPAPAPWPTLSGPDPAPPLPEGVAASMPAAGSAAPPPAASEPPRPEPQSGSAGSAAPAA